MSSFWQIYQQVRFILDQPIDLTSCFAIITAHNPKGKILTDIENQRLNHQLQREICNWRNQTIVGASLDLSHQEASFAVYCTKPEAISIAEQYAQNAIYWVSEGDIYLLPVLLKEDNKKLGRFEMFLVEGE